MPNLIPQTTIIGGLPYKIEFHQAMTLIFGMSDEDYCRFRGEQWTPLYGGMHGGTPWNKRKKARQINALNCVLNALFDFEIAGAHHASDDAMDRRKWLLRLVERSLPNLCENGWNMHDAMEWALDVRRALLPQS
jgi:hypothetical protein